MRREASGLEKLTILASLTSLAKRTVVPRMPFLALQGSLIALCQCLQDSKLQHNCMWHCIASHCTVNCTVHATSATGIQQNRTPHLHCIDHEVAFLSESLCLRATLGLQHSSYPVTTRNTYPVISQFFIGIYVHFAYDT